ncbi:hypothetical protein, partial [Stenotrophomonas maltophilia]|uniref:hypothetical protein n=1 Tax=Stenotrophomonas maltophilia TaxID=40324 RepID=UPI0034E2A31F
GGVGCVVGWAPRRRRVALLFCFWLVGCFCCWVWLVLGFFFFFVLVFFFFFLLGGLFCLP